MSFDPLIAATRFGFGVGPRISPADATATIKQRLAGPDRLARDIPLPRLSTVTPSPPELVRVARARRDALGTSGEAAAQRDFDELRASVQTQTLANFAGQLARAVAAEDDLRERLVHFWADHFTVRSRNSQQYHLVTPFVEEAVRPHVLGRFGDMLKSASTHPMMLAYLQQIDSHGPTSPLGLRRGRGLNENLARELLELHTLGVDAAYDQRDVRQLAELLTGLTYHPLRGFQFETRMSEPGAETVMGVTYSEAATLENVHAALDDLAAHPSTAAHIARKLAVHFLADDPDHELVDALTRTYLDTGGDLLAVTCAMIDHPAAWSTKRQKVRSPFEFIVAGLRSLDIGAEQILQADGPMLRRVGLGPLRVMGQPWERPTGPDGWPDSAAGWIIPQAMAARISWAMRMPSVVLPELPDPRSFLTAVLGEDPPLSVKFAAQAAETRAIGIGVILSSPAFQRR